MKRMFYAVFLVALVFSLCSPLAVLAEETAEEAAGGSSEKVQSMAAIGAALSIALGALGASIGMGLGLSKACEGVARNPGASGKIMTLLLVGLALIESLAIYAFLISLAMLSNQNMFF